ncbi:hypothetical protein [Streptomyces sp. NPDC091278]|uniref:hypothetical protein n=1 Tax=Streptomyces sp. NPDC091278 TaxID=3155301 RepID=UPI00344E6DC6
MHHPHENTARHRVVTLGPAGTNAQAEAARLFGDVVLEPSFESAMRTAYDEGAHALVAAGFVQRDEQQVTDLWVDLHFRHLGRMMVDATWESPTKRMCVATGPRALRLADVRSVALHPATEVFARRYVPRAARQYVDAKPLAVQRAADGTADACVGSLDVVGRHPALTVRAVFEPTMVWILYRPARDHQPMFQGHLPTSQTPANHAKALLASGA